MFIIAKMDIERAHATDVLLLYTGKEENKNVWTIKAANVKNVVIVSV